MLPFDAGLNQWINSWAGLNSLADQALIWLSGAIAAAYREGTSLDRFITSIA